MRLSARVYLSLELSQSRRVLSIAPQRALVAVLLRVALGWRYHWLVSELSSKTVPVQLVLGIGNVLKGDDGIGPYVAALLAEMAAGSPGGPQLQSIDCGLVPENYTGVVRRVRPDRLVLVDAAEMGLAEGETRIISPERAGSIGMSTHSMPLSLFVSYVRDLSGEVVIVGIQPGDTRFGQRLSPAVRVAGDSVARLLLQGLVRELRLLD